MISDSGRKLLEILFDEGEEVCVSHDDYGYHSVPIDHLDYETLDLKAPPEGQLQDTVINTSEIKLVAINPIKGFRRDENVTSFRNFLVEIDTGTSKDQLDYVWKMGLPYSVCVFSGNKSLHFAVCLDAPLPSYKLYYYYATWILKVMSKADDKTKNPSRSIRFAGNMRNGKEQKLVHLKTRVSLDTLNAWLSQFPGHRPTDFDETPKNPSKDVVENSRLIPSWVWNELKYGIDKTGGRNVQWFKIASEFGKAGFEVEEAIAILEQSFVSEYDFKRSEWVSTVKSGIKNGRRKAGFE